MVNFVECSTLKVNDLRTEERACLGRPRPETQCRFIQDVQNAVGYHEMAFYLARSSFMDGMEESRSELKDNTEG